MALTIGMIVMLKKKWKGNVVLKLMIVLNDSVYDEDS